MHSDKKEIFMNTFFIWVISLDLIMTRKLNIYHLTRLLTAEICIGLLSYSDREQLKKCNSRLL